MNSDCRAKTGSARVGMQDLVTTHIVTRAPGRPAKRQAMSAAHAV